jgi:hypothetical protein
MHERWQGLARIKQEVHRAAREGTVNSDQLWGLNSQACSTVYLGVDSCGQGDACWVAHANSICHGVDSVGAMAVDLGARVKCEGEAECRLLSGGLSPPPSADVM